MKYLLCVIACIAELAVYSFVLALLGFSQLGIFTGAVPLVLYYFTCRAILNHFKEKDDDSNPRNLPTL